MPRSESSHVGCEHVVYAPPKSEHACGLIHLAIRIDITLGVHHPTNLGCDVDDLNIVVFLKRVWIPTPSIGCEVEHTPCLVGTSTP